MKLGLFDIAYVMFSGIKSMGYGMVRYDVYESSNPMETETKEPKSTSTIFTAARILSSTFSQIPLDVLRQGEPFRNHRLYYNLRYKMNDVQNNQVFWSTLEYHRNIYGNAFVDLRDNSIIHPALVTDYDYADNGTVNFWVNWSEASDILGKKMRVPKEKDEWINSNNLLHFRGLSVDGVFGLPPVSAAALTSDIQDKAYNTIINFYKNRATSPMALESTITTASGAKVTLEQLKHFNTKYTGTYNSGKAIQLPPNTKLTPLQIHFADAELINTLKFTKEEIFNMYGIPSFLYNTVEGSPDIEQQSLSFKTFTIQPITKIYESEMEDKLLTRRERLGEITIKYNNDILINADLKSKAEAYKTLVTNGILSPSEASKLITGNPQEGEYANYHFMQMQYMPLEKWEENLNNGTDGNAGTN